MIHPSRPILVHMPESLIQKLDNTAKRNQISRSELIRLMLNYQCDNRTTVIVHTDEPEPADTPAGWWNAWHRTNSS